MERARRDRRNARDRRLIERKKQDVEQMKETLGKLEEQKRTLEAQVEAHNAQNQQETNNQQELDNSSDANDHPRNHQTQRHLQQQYLSVVRESEWLHAENRCLKEELSTRELVATAVEDVVNQFRDVQLEKPDGFPVSAAGAFALADAVCRQEAAVYQRGDMLPPCTNVSVFGWSDLRVMVGEHLDFAVRKSFSNTTAASMLSRTWQFLTNPRYFYQISPTICPGVPVICQFSDCVAVAWNCHVRHLVFNDDDCVLMVQASTLDGRAVMLVSTFNSATFERSLLTSPEPLHHACYWMFDDVVDDQQQIRQATVQVGGSLPHISAAIVHKMVAELVFNVVRWELLVARPNMLVWDDEPDTPGLPTCDGIQGSQRDHERKGRTCPLDA